MKKSLRVSVQLVGLLVSGLAGFGFGRQWSARLLTSSTFANFAAPDVAHNVPSKPQALARTTAGTTTAAESARFAGMAEAAIQHGVINAALDELLVKWAAVDPRAAAAWLRINAASLSPTSPGVGQILWKFAKLDPVGAMNLVLELPGQFEAPQFAAIEEAICQSGQERALLAFIDPQEHLDRFRSFARPAMSAMAHQNLDGAVRWFDSLPPALVDESITISLAIEMSRYDPERAIDWAKKLRPSLAGVAMQIMTNTFLEEYPPREALAMLEKREGPDALALPSWALTKAARLDAPAAIEVARRIDAKKVGSHAVDQVFTQWANEAPEEAAAWLRSHAH